MPSDAPPPAESITVLKAALAAAGGAAAVGVRLTGAESPRAVRYVIADACGTLSLFYLLLWLFFGLLDDWYVALGLAGLGAAAGWTAVYGMLVFYTRVRLAPKP